MAAPQRLAQLEGSAAAAVVAAGRGCFDAVQAGVSLWVAAKVSDRSIHVVHAPASGTQGGSRSRRATSGSRGGLHAVLHFPEPVAAVQLGVPTSEPAAAAGVASGTAVLLAVGQSCRAWAFQLQPPADAAPTAPAEVHADASAAAGIPVAQPHCPASHQLAAAVAWEHLACAWDPAAAAGAAQPATGSRGSRSRGASGGGAAAVVSLSLSSLQAALQQQLVGGGDAGLAPAGEQVPPLVHSVASWVCQRAPGSSSSNSSSNSSSVEVPGSQEGAGACIPADAVAVAYCGTAAGAAGRLVCSTRRELAARATGEGTAGGPVGHLLVATAAGQLIALPVGTLLSDHSVQPQLDATAQQAVVVCHSSSGMWLLHSDGGSSAAAVQPPPQQQLLAESGQLVPATASGVVLIAAGGGGGGSSSSTASGTAPPLPSVQLVGVRAAAAIGSSLMYLPSSRGSELRCWDAGSGTGAVAAVAAVAEVSADNIAQLVATSPASSGDGSAQPQLVLLTKQGELLAVTPPCCATEAQRGLSTSESASVSQLERSMQGLKAALEAAASIKGLLEMMFEVVTDWIEEFVEDIELASSGGGSSGAHQTTPRSAAASRRVSSAGAASPLLLTASAAASAQTMRIRQINHEAARNDSVGERVAHWKDVFREKGEELRAAVEEWQLKRGSPGGGGQRLTTAFLDGTHPVVDVYELKVRLEHMLQRLRVLQQASLTGRPVRLMPRLYLSGAVEASSLHLLRHLGITHVLNATEDLLLPEEGQGFVTHRVPLRDVEEEDLAPHLPDASAFIDTGLASGGGVLVHCHAGKSRSCSLVLAWLMTRRRWPLNRAMEFLRRVRPEAEPNAGYLKALLQLEEELFGRQTVKMKKTKPEPRCCPECGERVGLSADSVRIHIRLKHPASALARELGSGSWAEPPSPSTTISSSGLPSPKALPLVQPLPQPQWQQQQAAAGTASAVQRQQTQQTGQELAGPASQRGTALLPPASSAAAAATAAAAAGMRTGASVGGGSLPAVRTRAALPDDTAAEALPDSPPSMAAVLRAGAGEPSLTDLPADEFLLADARPEVVLEQDGQL